MIKKLLLIVILITSNVLFSSLNAARKTKISTNESQMHIPELGTVLFYRKGAEQSFPAISLESGHSLLLNFDILESQSYDLFYSIEQFDAGWSKTNPFTNEFLYGFNNQPIRDYEPSLNTTFDYVNYQVELPNDDIEILQTGNYEITVYLDSELKQPLLSRRFVVYSYDAQIIAEGDGYQNIEGNKMQKMNVEIDLSSVYVTDPQYEIKVAYLVNQDWRTWQMANNFRINSSTEITFENNNALSFYGGIEYRYFDNLDLETRSERTERISYEPPYFHSYLYRDKLQTYDPYEYREDFNGHFVLAEDDLWDDKHIEADYTYIHFKLKVDQPLLSRLYVYGALTKWQFTDESELMYIPDERAYTCKLLLKQGTYDYRYVMKDFDSDEVDWSLLEGSHAITENNVYIFVYYLTYDSDFERLVGFEIAGTK